MALYVSIANCYSEHGFYNCNVANILKFFQNKINRDVIMSLSLTCCASLSNIICCAKACALTGGHHPFPLVSSLTSVTGGHDPFIIMSCLTSLF